jgi:pyruvate,water dikinase
MTQKDQSIDILMSSLQERAKELNTLFKIEEFLNSDLSNEELLYKIIETMPEGMREPEKYHCEIRLNSNTFKPPAKNKTKCFIKNEIKIQEQLLGEIYIFFKNGNTPVEEAFFKEEIRLLKTVADRIAHHFFFGRIRELFLDLKEQNKELRENQKPEWMVVLEMLKKTDQNMYSILSRKMLNHMFCKGIQESREVFSKLGSQDIGSTVYSETNRPGKKRVLQQAFRYGMEIFQIASNYFGNEDLMQKIQKWIHEEKAHYLVKALANLTTPLSELADAIRRYHQLNPGVNFSPSPTSHGIKVSLIRRFLTDQLSFIDIAKNFCEIDDFYNLLQKMIVLPEGHGKLGGKGAGLFLAQKIIEKSTQFTDTLSDVKTPKTWYITSDGLMNFMYYNNMEDVIEQKYKDIDEIRQEYPHVVQAFKNSNFSPDMTNGLSRALDDFGENPVIVRSSSLLEDRMGSAFAGKYKSLFLANQGTKQERMEQLMDAIAEVYASTFGPDPIGYRIEKGLLDFNEEMGILIQQVVGEKVGKYFFPAFAGVAFSNNEFRWSPRIDREDGLIRLVPGLGTRAVDRIGNDYPVLVSPGKPDLRINQTFHDIVGYSPKSIDVINLETNQFETIEIDQLIKEVSNKYPMINEVFSIIDGRYVKKPIGLGIDAKKDDIVVTFENMISKGKYIDQLRMMIHELKDKLDTPVDIEFACSGGHLYLLQCRPQSSASENQSAVIPDDVPKDKIIFTANRYVSNGKVPNIAYAVYVDPENYSEIESLDYLMDIGKAVGKLNKMLPKKTFILMGPGRWGSRDDIRLGVKVTYSSINNTAVLIEIAKQKGSYTPDLSFGTHFFQDLVEANIRYLPLYPDNNDVIFKREFFFNYENTLTRFLPEFEHIADTLKVINIREATGGQTLRILLNADEDRAMGLLVDPHTKSMYEKSTVSKSENIYDEPLQWRKRMAESIALKLQPDRFGVKNIYLFGTVFNETAGPNSDIDLLVHFEGTKEQKRELDIWFEGWNHCLSQLNYNRSGYLLEDFLDITFLTDDDLQNQQYYKDIMNPENHASKKLKMKRQNRNGS